VTEEILSGQASRDVADIHEVVTDNRQVLDEVNELSYDESDIFNLSYFKKNNTLNSTVVSVHYLKTMVEMLEKGDYNTVLIEVGNDTPVIFSASEEKSHTLGTVAPRIDPGIKDQHYKAQIKHGKAYVKCSNEECAWSDKYESPPKAIEAGKDHRYYTGHEFEAYGPQGEKVKEVQEQ